MTKKQALNYLKSSGFSKEQIQTVVEALSSSDDLEVDCISRADAIKAMQDKAKKLTNEDTINGLCGAVAILFDLPSVTQEPRKGHWIWCVGSHKCSNCEEYTCFSHKELLRYCPNCGADMREVVEE